MPIFLITKDRLVDLTETIYSYHRHLRTPFEIVIHDEDSAYPPMLKFLEDLTSQGVPVYRAPHSGHRQPLDRMSANLAATISTHLAKSMSEYYVVSYPDVALDDVPSNLLLVYQTLLMSLNLHCVGASLRWDDWPQEMQSMFFERGQLLPAQLFDYNGRPIYYVRFPVDTTFGLYHRRSGPWRRDSKPDQNIRVLAPYGARHLDFYYVKGRVPPDMRHYLNRTEVRSVTHMHHLQ